MPSAALPENEEERLDSLQSYNVLDTLPEKEYDDIVKLASIICDTPIAMVSLVDEERQWFKSKIGVETKETPRDIAFCAHTILDPRNPLIVEDATKDERFADSDLVTGSPGVQFYAGYPLTTDSGQSLGALCAVDTKPRKLTEQQIESLRILASNVMSLLQLRKSHAANEKLLEKVTHSNEELERFAFICAHDLQEPLRMIRSFSEKLQNHIQKYIVDDEKGKKYLRFITDGAARSQNLIYDVLKYSQLSNQEEKSVKIESEELVDVIKEDLQDRLEEKNATITHDSLPQLEGNKTQLLQLFQNLINNGLKYQKPDTRPHVHISAEESTEHWEFAVKDNGIGMEKRHLSKIFEVFQRLHRKSKYSGTGIGLSICKKVVEWHGGRIWVESEIDQGSTFYFTIMKPAN